MTDPRIAQLAAILVDYSIVVKPRESVFIRGHVEALPLVTEVNRRVVQAGGLPSVILTADDIQEATLLTASDEQLQWISPLETMAFAQSDALISIRATSNTRSLSGVDPRKQQLYGQARRDLMQTSARRTAERSFRWVLTQYPCAAFAQEADMSLREFEDFVYATTYADQADPVACWREVHTRQQRLVDWLAGKKEVVIRGANVDLTLSIAGRNFINDDGKFNMPSGEIFTSPVEDSARGWVRFSYPAIREGREVEGVEFEFQAGKVVKARARKNEDYLLRQLDSDAGARHLGEWAIGTNYNITRFTKSILYDEKIGGTMHMAVGRGFAEIGGRNQSAIHWDFICDLRDDSEIRVDGDLFYKNGRFQV